MQSSNLKEIKAALWEQAFLGSTWVSCPIGQVTAIRRRKGLLLALIRGRGRWYPVESVCIEGAGVTLLQESLSWFLLEELWLGPLQNLLVSSSSRK
jgi:hypothetical protein